MNNSSRCPPTHLGLQKGTKHSSTMKKVWWWNSRWPI